jgi:hypothetical protein
MLRLRLPEGSSRFHFSHDLARPQTGGVHIYGSFLCYSQASCFVLDASSSISPSRGSPPATAST